MSSVFRLSTNIFDICTRPKLRGKHLDCERSTNFPIDDVVRKPNQSRCNVTFATHFSLTYWKKEVRSESEYRMSIVKIRGIYRTLFDNATRRTSWKNFYWLWTLLISFNQQRTIRRLQHWGIFSIILMGILTKQQRPLLPLPSHPMS